METDKLETLLVMAYNIGARTRLNGDPCNFKIAVPNDMVYEYYTNRINKIQAEMARGWEEAPDGECKWNSLMVCPTFSDEPVDITNFGVYGYHSMFFQKLDWEEFREKNPMPICYYGGHINPWEALKGLRIDVSDLKTMAQNYCPASDMTYTGFVPLAVLTDDSKRKYFDFMARPPYMVDMLNDGEWNRQGWFSFDKPRNVDHIVSSVDCAIMGSGYTSHFLPSDGSPGREFVAIGLDNGDKIICAAWKWFSK